MRIELLPILLLAPAVWALLLRAERARRKRLDALLGPRARVLAAERRRRRFVFLSLALLLALVAMLGPAWGRAAGDVRGADLVVCLDVSRSMLARDAEPDRLTRAKAEIVALADRASGDRLGLVVFAGEARAMVPLTEDMVSFKELLGLADPTSVGRGGTDLGAALEGALEVLQGRGGSVLLLTDGEDLGGRGLAAAKLLGERGVAVHCVGLGTELGSKIATEKGFLRDRAGEEVVSAMDVRSLRAIAAATGGTYGAHVPDISVARRTGESTRRENRFQWLLLPAILLWIVDLSRTNRRRP